MKIGVQLPEVEREVTWGELRDIALTVERCGLDSIWVGDHLLYRDERRGSRGPYEAWSTLAALAEATERVLLGPLVAATSFHSPAMLAKKAATVDDISGGRLILGLGVSGPQVVEGWYGQPYAKPLARTREYVEILRRIFRREEVDFQGAHYKMPLGADAGGTGLGKPLKSIVRPLREDIPIHLGAEGPKNVALAAEIGDGFARDGARRSAGDFEVTGVVPSIVGDDLEGCADLLRPMYALYIGGMGARDANFHFDVFSRLGYEGACHDIQDLYLAGRKDEAIAKVPTALVEDVALIGPPAKIAEDLERWKATCLTTMLVSGPPFPLEQIAEIVAS
jgi:alkanesulfonate monooxygenase SsuD/methylene tetrahydromethanopterin reductase-like flavin-dependent oxidoreductase (luciferase family)